MKILISVASVLIFAFCPIFAQAQTERQKARNNQPPPARGSITIRLVSDDGQPLDNASVLLGLAAAQFYSSETATRSKDGEFRFDKLKPNVYRVMASAPGYVRIQDAENAGANRYRIGDTATLRFTRGGAITGTATDIDGTPLIEARVRIQRVRSANNQAISPQSDLQNFEGLAFDTWTDDRGVYRAFGLPAGAYLISIGGATRAYSFGSVDPSDGAPTYYPSDPFDTAKEVFVNYGQEARGIDIQHRGGIGSTVSGLVSGVQKTSPRFGSGVRIVLAQTGGGQIEASTGVYDESNANFKLEQIADGEYLIQASQSGEQGAAIAASEPQKIRIAGTDVSGLQIRLQPYDAIAGKIVFEPNPQLKNKPECRMPRRFAPEEIELVLRREVKKDQIPSIYPRLVSVFGATPDETGAFELRRFGTEKYRLIAQMTNENLFVSSITDGKKDLSKEWIGAAAKNLLVTMADGAARLSGQIKPEEKDRIKTPEHFLVHLVPAEKDAEDNVLRYYEVLTEEQSVFNFANVTPGKYFLLVRPFQIDKEKPSAFRQPIAWNAEKRQALRGEAEAGKVEIELAPCQTIADREIIFEKK